MDEFSVIVVAAGKGTRMETMESKQYLPLDGIPILVHTLQVFESIMEAKEVVLVVGEHDLGRCEGYVNQYGLKKVNAIVSGGAERQSSVYRGLQALRAGAEWVLIHDGVRPFVKPEEVLACWGRAMEKGASVLAVPVKDTIKQVSPDGVIVGTPDRSRLWAIHTPQAFRVSDIRKAHEQAVKDGFLGTDDAMLMERMGHAVEVVPGGYHNVKITTMDDLEWAEWKMQRRKGETRS